MTSLLITVLYLLSNHDVDTISSHAHVGLVSVIHEYVTTQTTVVIVLTRGIVTIITTGVHSSTPHVDGNRKRKAMTLTGQGTVVQQHLIRLDLCLTTPMEQPLVRLT